MAQPRVALFVAADDPGAATALKVKNCLPQRLEQAWREHFVVVSSAGAGPQIITRPDEAVEFVKACREPLQEQATSFKMMPAPTWPSAQAKSEFVAYLVRWRIQMCL